MLRFWAALTALFILIPALSLAALSNQDQRLWQGVIVFSMQQSIGSGVPVSRCHILTNEHVIRGGNKAAVLVDSENYDADVISVEIANDLALLRIAGCPIKLFAKIASEPPVPGEILTSVYYKPRMPFSWQMSNSRGLYKGMSRIITEEDKEMASMVIADSQPRKRSSGGGVSSAKGLVSVIFGIAAEDAEPMTYAVDYYAMRKFLAKNGI